MARALLILSKPYPEDPRVNRETISLSRAGHSIRVLSWDRESRYQSSPSDGSDVEVEFLGPPCPRRNFLAFLLRLPRFWLSCLIASRRTDFTLVHAHDLDTLPIGFLIGRLRGKRVIYDSHESYADMISDDVPRTVSRLARALDGWLVRKVDQVVVANERISSLIGADDAIVVMNCPSLSELPADFYEPMRVGNQFVLAYFGSLEPGRFILEAIDSVSRRDRWKFLITGNGTLREAVEEAAKRCDRIEYLGHLAHDEVMAQMSHCHAMLAMGDPSNRNHVIGTPTRIFEAMATGIPSIVSRGTFASEIIASENCGFICNHDPASFAHLLEQIESSDRERREKGMRGREAFQREYNWENQVSKLILAYLDIGKR